MRRYLQHIWSGQRRKTLRDFIRLVFAFFACLIVLSAYQYVRLYLDGVLPSFWNSSFFTLVLHHSGFTALISFFLAFGFHFLEQRRRLLGFSIAASVFLAILILEGLLIEYYVRYYEILGIDFISKISERSSIGKMVLGILLLLPITAGMMAVFYKINSSSYRVLNKMYPFTIILFTWFLATLVSEKNPINENKTQHLAESFMDKYLHPIAFESKVEYPLLRPFKSGKSLADRFDFRDSKPNIVFIIMEGLESRYLDPESPVSSVMPYLNSVSGNSLRWENHIGNSDGSSSLPVILGSLPLAENSILDSEAYVNRNSLFSVLGHNGYRTSFYYGGNSAIGRIDKFLTQERIDALVDRKNFGPDYTPQDKDAAGISLGYPDKELFRYWNDRHMAMARPKLEVFYTLSTRKPYLIPDKPSYRSRVGKILDEAHLDQNARREFRRQRDLLASMAYADDALKELIETYYKQKPEYNNTVFVITGNRETKDEFRDVPNQAFHVPLMIYSPLLKGPETFHHLVSHADITPALAHILDDAFHMDMPSHVAWTGSNLSPENQPAGKEVPIHRENGTIGSLLKDHYLLAGEALYKMNQDREWLTEKNPGMVQNLARLRSDTEQRNAYMIANNKILPVEHALFTFDIPAFTKREIAWINSIFNGKDYDAAYEKARELALDNKSDRALLLCRYILAKVPGHVDTEILMGRIYGWQQHFTKAAEILEGTIVKYPSYPSAYEALLDVYYWSNNNRKSLEVAHLVRANNIQDKAVLDRITRAKNILKSERKAHTVSVLPEKVRR